MAEPRIAIVNYGVGNLLSIAKALRKAGALPIVATDFRALVRSDAIVLPGVGAFDSAMEFLRTSSVGDKLAELEVPLLGICLGMQVLLEESEEAVKYKGLALVRGKCVKLPSAVKIPHMGWNSVAVKGRSRLLSGIESGTYFYFVHSYAPLAEEAVVATTYYGAEMPCAIEKENVFGTLFHPEKSSVQGLRVLRNFVRIAAS